MNKHARMLALLLAVVAPLSLASPAHAAPNMCQRAEYHVFHDFGSMMWGFWNSYWVNVCDH